MPSLAVDPVSSTALAIRLMASMPPATHHSSVSLTDLALEHALDQILALRRQLAGGVVAAAAVADGVDLLPVGRLVEQAGDLARGHRGVADERHVPAHRGAGVEQARVHAGGDAPDHDRLGAGILGAQHVGRHVRLGRVDIGLVDHLGAVLLEAVDRGIDRGDAIAGGVADHRDLLHLEDVEAVVAHRVVPLACSTARCGRRWGIWLGRSGCRPRRDGCSASWRAP